MEDRRRRLRQADHLSSLGTDEADVGEPVVAFLLESREQERAARNRLVREGLGKLRAAQLSQDQQS